MLQTLFELMKSNEFIRKTHHKGTYAGIRFSEETKATIEQYIKENSIPNATPTEKLHCTLLYSRKRCPDYKAQGKLEPMLRGKPGAFQVWEGQPDEEGHRPNCLVLEFDCAELTARHNELMKEHKATYDFPDYKTHMTFSYDVAEMDIKVLPAYTGLIEMVEEYSEVLDIDWAQHNAKDK